MTSVTRPDQRVLTAGEVALTRAMFGPAVDPLLVLIYNKRWWPLQPRRVIMAPDGNLWCHPRGDTWRADWSVEPPHGQAYFLHEMTHVWQWQRGICLMFERWPLARYRYSLTPGKPLEKYGIEQQAEIVRHAHLARCGFDNACAAPAAVVQLVGSAFA